jgi:hypothetical protein
MVDGRIRIRNRKDNYGSRSGRPKNLSGSGTLQDGKKRGHAVHGVPAQAIYYQGACELPEQPEVTHAESARATVPAVPVCGRYWLGPGQTEE